MIEIDTARRAALYFSIFGFLFYSEPTDPSARALDSRRAAELARFGELAEWIEPRNDMSLSDAVRERSESFDLFLSHDDDALLSARLVGLPYGPEIRETADRYSVDALLLASIIEVESGFDPHALSHRGATGLMQVMPSTAGAAVDLYDPEHNLEVGARYLNHLLRRFEGDLTLALAAYNAGPTNVRRYGGVPPFRETRRYVDKVLKLYVDHHRHVWKGVAAKRLATSKKLASSKELATS